MRQLDTFRLNLRYAFNLRKPELLARLGKAVLLARFPGPPRLRYVDFAIDFRCNLRCEHCFATALVDRDRPRMEVADYARVAREAMALGAVNFSFQGGEPLLDARLPAIIQACQPQRNVISVTTNGTLLDRQKVRELRRIGVDILTVSLDSGEAETHDRFRGVTGSFDKTLRGIDLALAEGLHVTLGTVVTHESLRSEGLRALIELAVARRLILSLILPVPAGEWTTRSDMMLTEEDEAFLETLVRSSPFIRTDFDANLGGYGCGAAKEILYLTPYGDVLVCPFLHAGFGNVFQEPIASIRARALRDPWLDHYHRRCLVSTDHDFVQRHLSRTFGAERLPLPAEEVFGPSGDRP